MQNFRRIFIYFQYCLNLLFAVLFAEYFLTKCGKCCIFAFRVNNNLASNRYNPYLKRKMNITELHLVGFMFVLFGWTAAVDEDCNFQQTLESGKTYYVFNPGYPNNFRGKHFCKWISTSTQNIRLNCTVNLPPSVDCGSAKIIVTLSNGDRHVYCGNGNTYVESLETMTIEFISDYNSGGNFLCNLYSIPVDKRQDCQCGWKNPTRIVGGMETGVNEYPMMAGLVNLQQRNVMCGAVIIAHKYVLTSAHCVYNQDASNLGVLVGDHDISTGTDTNATSLFRVTNVAVHPRYNARNKTSANDAAIITIRGSIQYSMAVGPVCLPFQHNADSFGGSYVDLIGWGTTEYGGPRSDVLQKVRVSILTRAQCEVTNPSVTSRQLCADGSHGKDSCQLDSGGPVLWENPTTRRLVSVGIISYGGICGYAPSINTRVGAYLDWIQSETPDVTYCEVE